MRTTFAFATGLAVTLVLLITSGAHSISRTPLAQRQPAASVGGLDLGRTIVVSSTADSGPSTLRQALENARNGDAIIFNPTVFPPTRPMTITLISAVPDIIQGNLTIDASNAGVILDGSNIGTTPETLLVDDVSLKLAGGPNLIANGDFGAGLGHWRPWDEGPGPARSLNSSDFHASPPSYAWTTVAHAGESHTVYDRTDTSDPLTD